MTEEKLKEKINNIRNDDNRIVSLSSDVIFKAVFKKCERVLITMIKDIFEIEDDIYNPITIVGYESLPINRKGKVYRADLLVRLSDKSSILIEMNNSNDEEVIDRNLVQLVRIHSDMLPKGLEDSKLKEYRLKGINFNNFPNTSGDPIEMFAFCNIKTKNIVSMMYSFCNVDLEKCRNLVYDIGVRQLPKSVRWGSILKEENIRRVSDILGEDMLSMEDKKEFIDSIKEINSDESVLNDWLLEELAKHKARCQMEYAMKEGREKGAENKELELIKNMLNETADYNFISKVTGKTIEEIKEIENNIE